MDEPFGALDPVTRENLQDELKKLQARLKKTIVFVTHDMDEALKLGDRVVIMKDGKVVQADTPEMLLRKPADDFVRQFIGRERLAVKADGLTVDDVAIKTPVTAPPHMGLAQATRLMQRKHVDTLMVVDDDGKFVGIASAREIEALKRRPDSLAEVVQKDVATVMQGSSAKQAFEMLFIAKVGVVPVIDGAGRLHGIVTRGSLAEMLYQALWDSNGDGEAAGNSRSNGANGQPPAPPTPFVPGAAPNSACRASKPVRRCRADVSIHAVLAVCLNSPPTRSSPPSGNTSCSWWPCLWDWPSWWQCLWGSFAPVPRARVPPFWAPPA